MRAVVTGAAGYIAAEFVRLLRLHDWEVEAIDVRPDSRSKTVAVKDYVPPWRPDFVFHLAAHSNIEQVEADPDLALQDVADCIEVGTWGANRVVFTSSSAVYAEHKKPVTEESPLGPSSVYGEGKLAGEKQLGPDDVILRLFNVIGDYGFSVDTERNGHLVPALRKRWFMLHGDDWPTADGSTVRTWCDILSVHRALLRATTLPPGVYNVGGSILSTKSLISLWEISHGPVQVTVGPRRAGDVAQILGDSRKLESLGWSKGRPMYEIVGSL